PPFPSIPSLVCLPFRRLFIVLRISIYHTQNCGKLISPGLKMKQALLTTAHIRYNLLVSRLTIYDKFIIYFRSIASRKGAPMEQIPPDSPLMRLMSRVVRQHHYNSHLMLKDHNVHPGQPPVLFELTRQDGLRQSELAERLRIKPSTVTVMLNRMVKNRL